MSGVRDASSRETFETVPHRSRSTSLVRFERSALSVSGLVLLTATKFADALTTGVGLRYVPGIYEANPIVDRALQEIGVVAGLTVSSFVVIVGIALITEIAAIGVTARRRDGHLAPIVRIAGYGIPAALFALVSVYNATVLLAGIDAGGLGVI